MKNYSKMQLLKMVEDGELSPKEALKKIKQLKKLNENKPQIGNNNSIRLDKETNLLHIVEKELIEGVAQVLKVPINRINVDVNMREFGFDSISFTAYNNYITEKFKINFSPNIFFEYETIYELSEYISTDFHDEILKLASEVNYSSEEINQYKQEVPKKKNRPNKDVEIKHIDKNSKDNLWIIDSSDEFPLEFWKKLKDIDVDLNKYKVITNTELNKISKKYVHLLVNTSIGKKMEVVSAGRGRTKVIVGGVGMATPMIINQLKYFSKYSRVISIHNPGCGLSEDINDYSLEERVKIIADVLKNLEINEPIDFIGVSWGSMIGQYFSIMYPEKISSLILVSSIYEIVNENPNSNADDAMKKDLEIIKSGEDYINLLEYGTSIDTKIFAKYMEYYLPGNSKSYTTLDILDKIKTPVFVVYGKRDTIINTRQSKVIIDHIPGAKFLEIEDGAHFNFMTHHELLNEEIEKFILDIDNNNILSLKDSDDLVLKYEEKWEKELNIKGMECYDKLEERLKLLCTSYAYTYLKKCGIDTSFGKIHDRNELVATLNILPNYRKIFDCMIEMLVEDKVVRALDSKIQFIKAESLIMDSKVLYKECIENYSEFAGMINFLDYCVNSYEESLCGKIVPIGVLFPKGSSDALEKSNKDTIEYGKERIYASVISDILKLVVDKKGEKVRILEVGGGTGLLTKQVVSVANLPNVEYYFTDIGEYFINQAKENDDFKSINFKAFDITKNPIEQGFDYNSFDIILGLNVVHATKDIIGTVVNLKPLLIPNGIMMLIEASKSLRWVDMVWGLAEGWWYFEDKELRDKSPVIDIYTWEKVFLIAKFGYVKAYPSDDAKRFETNCALVVAQK
ncbi:alpha/beta fold hydrolase [Clostridium estertheticum]|uniref:alpha/beta fold hydrolase n=1 Tax=Clostridium estertheticum TaxID=238834 RepID=UPI0013EEA8F1|nr:alpha/beta fold hydrolase [Clostridium estertheticum]MBZ9609082.1 alpha/beta fold hydrolase [Clostridium estertheticum]